ncbi:hypothetical protein D3C73_1161290 [compost metagenome]
MQRFTQQGKLQAVADKARCGAIEHHRLKLHRDQPLLQFTEIFRFGCCARHDFNQRNKVRWIPEMCDQQPLRVREFFRQRIRRQATGVAGDNRFG